MTHKTYFLLILALCGMVLLAPSCRSGESDIPEQAKADVTVMIYGSGGGSLDRSMIGKFRNLYRADPEAYKHVQVAVQFKFSEDEKMPGWSRWLRLNRHEPSMWSKSGFEEELDEDDE